MGNCESGVSDHDDIGVVDDTRDERHETSAQIDHAVSDQNEKSDTKKICCNGSGERREEIRKQVVEAIAEGIEDDVEESFSIGLMTSGPIPNASEFNAYPEFVQKKIVEWHDREIKATCSDESQRQNDLVDAEIKSSKRKQVLSFVIDLILILGPLVAYCVSHDSSVFWAYSILGASIIGNVVININKDNRKSKRNKDE